MLYLNDCPAAHAGLRSTVGRRKLRQQGRGLSETLLQKRADTLNASFFAGQGLSHLTGVELWLQHHPSSWSMRLT